jgi:hypothetical protein
MRARAARAVLAALAAVAVLLPASAAASSALSASSTEALSLPAAITTAIRLRGSHGYRIELSLIDHRRLLVTAIRGSARGGEQSVFYYGSVPRRSNGTEFVASLGKLGRVDVRFHPESRTVLPTEGECVGEGTTFLRGRFVGTIVFRGERGYTKVDARRARGDVSREGAQVCGDAARLPGTSGPWGARDRRSAPGRQLYLDAHNRSRRVVFEAGRIDGYGRGSEAYFNATTRRRTGGLHVISTASLYPQDAREFHLPDPSHPLAAAVLRPGGPFSGTATFTRESPTRGSWEGDLAVELPGLGEVPLTGPQVSPAAFCSGATCTDPTGGGSG